MPSGRKCLNEVQAICYSKVFSTSGNNSVVECDLAKVEVAGSNPVSRSIRLSFRLPSAKRKLRSWQAIFRENVLSEPVGSRRLTRGESKDD